METPNDLAVLVITTFGGTNSSIAINQANVSNIIVANQDEFDINIIPNTTTNTLVVVANVIPVYPAAK